MSKEQTPIIEIIEKEIDSAILMSNDIGQVDRCKRRITELMEQYAQAKVLEALEREFKKIDVQYYESGFGNKEQGGKYYYETEVKPKYKL